MISESNNTRSRTRGRTWLWLAIALSMFFLSLFNVQIFLSQRQSRFISNISSSIDTTLNLLSTTITAVTTITTAASNINNCPDGLVYIDDIIHEQSSDKFAQYKIPPIFFQTMKSRCVHSAVAKPINAWREALPEFSFRMYDDDAMDAMLYDEKWESTFPGLKYAVKCIDMINNPTMKADIWRYLVLWEYGGIYSDTDTAPRGFNSSHIYPDDDGLFFIERLRVVTQYWFAVSPKHPMMYHAIHSALHFLFEHRNIKNAGAAVTTGPNALKTGHRLFIHNLTDVYFRVKPIKNPTIIKQYNGYRSFRVAEEYRIIRDSVGHSKGKVYESMNMTHFLHRKKGILPNGSCYALINATEIEDGYIVDGKEIPRVAKPIIQRLIDNENK